MWPSRDNRGGASVTCIACGKSLPRNDAREYDKHGDRWERRGKEFEFLCKPCDRSLCHQPRDDLEALLLDAEAGESDRDTFFERYADLVEDRYGPLEEQ
ncbi:hypothetical protein QA599_12275 [Haloarculaceae archaeon H-GB1-1]|nr:hypothetical protein [Haloarculaceae archaeon H-GB1-1]